MEPKSNPDVALAAHLAKPFLLPGQSGQPLSLRCLPDGGMVVIACDGRKLWFTAREVCKARKELNQPAVKTPQAQPDTNFTALHEPDPHKPVISSHIRAKSRDGMSELISLPESLKFLEERVNEQSRKYHNPHKAASG